MSNNIPPIQKDIFAKCSTDAGYFGKMRAIQDSNFTRPILSPTPDRVMEFKGKSYIMWSVNNYLGLANHPQVLAEAHKIIDTFGISSPMGSRMMSGNTEYHKHLEQKLAEAVEKDSAYLFNYGYLGVQGTIQALAGKNDTVVMDKLAHACIVDGAFLAQSMNGAELRIFRHNNMESLEQVLRHVERSRKGGILILIEGVYGMTGDLANLKDIAQLKNRYDARIYIDDAHGWGVMGQYGRGTADHCGVQKDMDIYFGTFAKSFASIGGFSASTKAVTDWIAYNARTQVFAKSLPILYVQTLKKTLELVINGDEYRKRMWYNAQKLKTGIQSLGYYLGPGKSPICSVFIPLGDRTPEEVGPQTLQFLRDRGIFVTAVSYPVIPIGLLMFRMIPTALHQEEDIEKTLAVFKEMRETLPLRISVNKQEEKVIRKLYNV